MRAVVYLGDGRYEVRDVPTPVPASGEVLVRVEANTICGTDLRIVSGAKRKGVEPPVILGHEVGGRIEALGAEVEGLRVGERVSVTPSLHCRRCWACQRGLYHLCARSRVLGHVIDGGLAEFYLAPADQVADGGVVPAPEELTAEEVALAEPLSCVLHAHDLLRTGPGDVVLILGGGPIGQLHAQLARVRGARTVIVSEPVASRRELASRLGAQVVLDPTTVDLAAVVAEHTDGAGADVVVACVGVPALVATALELARPRGRVSLFAGFPVGVAAQIDPNLIHYRELMVTGSSNSTAADIASALGLIAGRQIDVAPLVSHRFSLDNFADAVDHAAAPEAMKVAVRPWD